MDGLKFSDSTLSYGIHLTKHSKAHLVGVFLEDLTVHSYRLADVASYEGASFDEHMQELNEKDREERGESKKGMALGADDYIPKPFDTTDLLNAIESRLNKAEQIKKRISQGLNGVNELITIMGGEKTLSDFVEEDSWISTKKSKEYLQKAITPSDCITFNWEW